MQARPTCAQGSGQRPKAWSAPRVRVRSSPSSTNWNSARTSRCSARCCAPRPREERAQSGSHLLAGAEEVRHASPALSPSPPDLLPLDVERDGSQVAEGRGEVGVNAAQLLENFLQALTAGLLTGAIYGLMCVGLSVIFGVMRVINFAQGDFMMLGMYVAYYAFGLFGRKCRSSARAIGPVHRGTARRTGDLRRRRHRAQAAGEPGHRHPRQRARIRRALRAVDPHTGRGVDPAERRVVRVRLDAGLDLPRRSRRARGR